MGRTDGGKQGSSRPEKPQSGEGVLTTVVWKRVVQAGSGLSWETAQPLLSSPLCQLLGSPLCRQGQDERLTLAFSRKMLSLGGATKSRKPPHWLERASFKESPVFGSTDN